MMRQQRADLAMNAAILLLGASLVFSGYSLLHLHQRVFGTAGQLDLPELLAVGAAGCGVALLAWWLLAMSCAVIAAIAQTKGADRVASVSGAFAPAFMGRVVITVLGLNLLAAPLANAADSPGVDPRWHGTAVATAPATAAGTATVPGTAPATATTPATAPAQDPLPAQAEDAVEPQWIPRTAETNPDMMLRPGNRAVPSANGANGAPGETASNIPGGESAPLRGDNDVVVKSGDSLWSIVAAALGPYASDVDVAASWPDWYRANRETIGTNPNLIFPGQILHAPLGP